MVSDGLEAVHAAQKVQPDLILLDIGLPTLNGIEAARRIRVLSPNSKIIFVTQESSADIVQEALRIGVDGYVVKADAGSELLVAVTVVLQGKQFVGSRFDGNSFTRTSGTLHSKSLQDRAVAGLTERKTNVARRHDVGFYSDDRHLLDDLTRFVGDAMAVGRAAIVIAAESHRENLSLQLQVHGFDVAKAIEQGRYVAVDAENALSTFMVNGMPDPIRFNEAFSGYIRRLAESENEAHRRVAIFGEGVSLLSKEGNVGAAIEVEKLCNLLVEKYDVDILCWYSLDNFPAGMAGLYEQICAEHSAIHSG